MTSRSRLLNSAAWTAELSAAIDAAQKTVHVLTFTVIATPQGVDFAQPDPYRSLEAAAQRGVDVRLVRSATQHETLPSTSGHAAAARLIYAGAQVRCLPPRPTLHAKAHCIDSARLFVGSANISRSSAASNIELGASLDNAIDIAEFEALFSALWATAQPEPMPHPSTR